MGRKLAPAPAPPSASPLRADHAATPRGRRPRRPRRTPTPRSPLREALRGIRCRSLLESAGVLAAALLVWWCPTALAFDWSGRIDQLAEDLNAPSPTTRRQALERLGTFPPSDVARYVIGALDDENPQVRVAAARILGRGRVRDAVEPLVGWLTDQEEEVRQTACVALGRIGDPRAISPLARVMGDSSPNVRRAAVEALAAIGTDDVVVPLIGRLGDSHPRVRQAAAEGLGRLMSGAAVVPLVSRLQDPVQPVRLAVIGALARIGDERASGALIQSLRDPSPEVRANALAALARLGAEEAVVPTIGLLADENETVRSRAVAALGAIGNDRAIAALVERLGDPALSSAAGLALVEVGEPAVEALCSVLRQSTNRQARTAALEVLVRIGASAAAPTLVAELESGGGGLPTASLVAALGRVVDPTAFFPLLDRLDDESSDVRLAALIAISSYLEPRRPSPRAAEALVARLDSGDAREQLVALLLLARIGDARVAATAAELATDGDRATDSATVVLRRAGDDGPPRLRDELTSALSTGWPLRTAAIRALGASRAPAASATLLHILETDRRAALRHEAALALGRLSGEQVVVELDSLLHRQEPIDRAAVVLALGIALRRSPNERARRSLEALTRAGDGSLALRAADALARAGDRDAVPTLVELASRPDATTRRKAVEVLGELGGEAARSALREAVSDDDPLVRGLAIWALGKIGGEGVTELLTEHLDDRGWSVAINAAGALARLGDPAAGGAICAALQDTHGIVHLESNLLLAAAASDASCTLDRASEAYRRYRIPTIRGAAARALGHYLASSPSEDDAAAVTALLRTCRSEDESPDVQEACSAALAPAAGTSEPSDSEGWIELYLYAGDGRRLRPRGRFLLVMADGVTKAGVTDANGFAREAPAPEGRYQVHDPASARVAPR